MPVTEPQNKRLGWLRRLARPIRSFFAWVFLVREEQGKRRADIDANMARVDLMMQEIWRRMEAATANNTVELQKLRDDVEALRAELARIRESESEPAKRA